MGALTRVAMSLEAALVDEDAFLGLVDNRASEPACFLRWAASCEAREPDSAVRFEHRADLKRCRSLLDRFHEPWWGVVVYSCFDSISGTEAVASAFAEPLPPARAARAIRGLDTKVQAHRAQVGRQRSKQSLVSACEKAEELERVLTTPGRTFDERFWELGSIHVWGWRRTTNFDALVRGGMLKLDGVGYRPTRAYLAGSQGPAAGFEGIWGIPVTRENSDACEELLVRWTQEWERVASRVGVV